MSCRFYNEKCTAQVGVFPERTQQLRVDGIHRRRLHPNDYDAGRLTARVKGESAKIQIARDDDTCVGECGFKNSAVRGTGHTDVRNTNDIVTCGTKELDGNGVNVLIDQRRT